MRRVIAAAGRGLVTVGILILLLVAYQLWGTGLYEARQQSKLKHQFAQTLQQRAPPTTTPTTTGPAPTTATTAPIVVAPPSGEAVAIIRIPKIGVDSAVVEGVGRPDLRKGPGHYPLTPMPGQIGNAAIAGHRTTYGAPFYRLNELGPGDDIAIRTTAGTYHYQVTKQLVVLPTDVSVLDPTPDATLTLTTCEPRYSAQKRLVIHAALVAAHSPPPAPAPTPAVIAQTKAKLSSAGLSGSDQSRLLTLWWGLAAALVGGLWWLLFHRHPRWTTWFAGVLPFLLVLFVFYSYLDRLLPANY
ncbi:MAG: class E sortase [Actinobacteria bacterium]|nr:class E sortase [Actinomycetota bacterium]